MGRHRALCETLVSRNPRERIELEFSKPIINKNELSANNIQVNFINKFKISWYYWRKGIMSRNSLALQNIESNLERWNSLSRADINDEIEGDAPDETELSKFPGILETLKSACPMKLDLRKISTPFSKLERTIETAGFIRHEMMECIERSNRRMPRARQESGAMWR